MAGLSTLGFGLPASSPVPDPVPISGKDYLIKLHKYFALNLSRLAPPPPPRGKGRGSESTTSSFLSQSYTILTLGLDPSSAPLSPAVKIPLTLGFASPTSSHARYQKPVLLRLPPDKLLYLLLRWQSLPQQLAHVGRTDTPVPDGVGTAIAAKGHGPSSRTAAEGDVESVRSWVGSMRSVSLGSRAEGGWGWFGRQKEVDENKLLLELYSIFNILPGILIHPPYPTEQHVVELMEAGGYTTLGGIDVRVPLDVLRNLQILELEGYDPRGLLIPISPLLHSLTVRNVEDADDWVVELLAVEDDKNAGRTVPDTTTGRGNGASGNGNGEAAALDSETGDVVENPFTPSPSPGPATPRFPNLRYLCLHHTSLLSLPPLPLTSLTHLDLSGNLLNAIPDSLAGLHNLVSLDLSSNVITSVRNAPAALGNIHTLNLAHNRVDCLVGLDRVLGLRRVDVRANALEAGEVGRLAVLPVIEAVWAADNPMQDEWRVEVAASFTVEGRDVILDDIPLSYSEQRRVAVLLAARGKVAPRPAASEPPPSPTPAPPPVELASPTKAADTPAPHLDVPVPTPPPSATLAPPSPTRHASLVPSPAGRQVSPVPSPSRTQHVRKPSKGQKKRPKRRVVNLDGDDHRDDA